MDHNVPDVFELSTDKEPFSEEYIPIDSINNRDTDEDDENDQEMKENSRLLGIWTITIMYPASPQISPV